MRSNYEQYLIDAMKKLNCNDNLSVVFVPKDLNSTYDNYDPVKKLQEEKRDYIVDGFLDVEALTVVDNLISSNQENSAAETETPVTNPKRPRSTFFERYAKRNADLEEQVNAIKAQNK